MERRFLFSLFFYHSFNRPALALRNKPLIQHLLAHEVSKSQHEATAQCTCSENNSSGERN